MRCSDGSSQGVGSYHPSAESSGYLVDNPCLLGFDAVKAIGGRGVSYFDGRCVCMCVRACDDGANVWCIKRGRYTQGCSRRSEGQLDSAPTGILALPLAHGHGRPLIHTPTP